jgi:hypothetical protein
VEFQTKLGELCMEMVMNACMMCFLIFGGVPNCAK